MSKLKTIYQMLEPTLKKALDNSAREYDSAKRLKYTLMGSTLWHELTLDDVSSIISFTGLYTYELTSSDIMYGSRFLKK